MINTERLTLQPISVADKTPLSELFADNEVMKFSDDGPQNSAQTSDWVDKAISDYQKKGYGALAVVDKQTREIIGYCGLFNYANIAGRPEIEIGYRLISRAWGKGFATEAARALLEQAHTTLKLSRIVALIDPGNVASKKVAEKIGLSYEKDVMMPGYTHPDLLYVSEPGRLNQ